jgi:hypothetical protein
MVIDVNTPLQCPGALHKVSVSSYTANTTKWVIFYTKRLKGPEKDYCPSEPYQKAYQPIFCPSFPNPK